MDTTFERIRNLVADHLDLDPETITMESNFVEDLEADSLDLVDMVMTLEDEFGIELPDEAAEMFLTVGDIVKYIEEHT